MSVTSLMRRGWVAFRKPLLLLISLTVSLGIAELVVRALGIAPQVYSMWTYGNITSFQRSDNPLLGYEYKPNFREDTPAAGSASLVFASINSDGLRDIERSVEKPPGTRRVILLGDSVVSGHGTPDLDHTISRRLEAHLQDDRIEVLNVSVCGYNTRAEVELLRTKGLKYEPDLVVLVFTSNDYEDANAGGDVAKYGGTMSGHQALMMLCVHSSLVRSAAVQLGLLRLGDTIDVQRWHRDAMGTKNVVEGLRVLQQLSVEHGFPVIVAVWPGFMPGEIIEWSDMPFDDLDQSDVIARLAEQQGFTLMPLAPYFQDHWQSLPVEADPVECYTVDRMHPSVVGANVAARALAPVCREVLSGVSVSAAIQATRAETAQIVELTALEQPSSVAVRPQTNEVYVVEAGRRQIIKVGAEPPYHSQTVITGFGGSAISPESSPDTDLYDLGFMGESALWVTGSGGSHGEPWLRIYELTDSDQQQSANQWTLAASAREFGMPPVDDEIWRSAVAAPTGIVVASRRMYSTDLLREVSYARSDTVAREFHELQSAELHVGVTSLALDPQAGSVVVGRMGGPGPRRDSGLSWIDPASHQLLKEAPLSLRDLVDLAFHPHSDTLYALDSPAGDGTGSGLYRIDPDAEDELKYTATRIVELHRPTSMAFDQRGRLYVTVGSPSSTESASTGYRLIRIDDLR